jgi:hypothetical protein
MLVATFGLVPMLPSVGSLVLLLLPPGTAAGLAFAPFMLSGGGA